MDVCFFCLDLDFTQNHQKKAALPAWVSTLAVIVIAEEEEMEASLY